MNLFILLGNSIMIGVFFLQRSLLPPQIPLFYSKQPGEDQVGEWWMIFALPVIMNIFFLINYFIYKKFFFKNEFVSKVLQVINCLVIISFTLIFIKIILLVTV